MIIHINQNYVKIIEVKDYVPMQTNAYLLMEKKKKKK